MNKIIKILMILLIAVALFFVNAFFGNPISKAIASRAANKYIDENYINFKLKREKIFYNFKNAAYTVRIQDEESEDTKFEVAFDSLGRFKYDSFDDIKFNTWLRFQDELRNYGKELAKKENLPFELNLSSSDEKDLSELTLDEKVDFDHFPFRVDVNVFGYAKEPNNEKLIEYLQEASKVMEKTPLEIKSYSIILVPEKNRKENGEALDWKDAPSVYGIPKEKINDLTTEYIDELIKEGNKPKDN